MDQREYRLMLLVGIFVTALGMLAYEFDAEVASVISLTVGALIFLAGVAGLFWNSD